MKNRGVALIISIGILAVLVIFATSFALNMSLEQKAAYNYLASVKAKYLAEAGINMAIAELKAHARTTATDTINEQWAQTPAYTGNLFTDSSYNVTVVDEQRKVNINNANALLLDNLPGLSATDVANIINYRTTSSFKTIDEIKLVSGIGQDTYNNIKDYITVDSYVDTHFDKSPVNVNTATLAVIKAVLAGLRDGANTISPTEADTLANHLIGDDTNKRPFSSWQEFNNSINNAVSDGHITAAKARIIKNNCNPNRNKPSAFTAEFCFDSGGVYTLNSIGTVRNPVGTTIAQKKIKATVRIYKIWNQTAKEEFRGEDINYNGALDTGEDTNGNSQLDFPSYEKVTWMDSCPLNYSALDKYGYDPMEGATISGSVKIGFWDNFEEDILFSQTMWKAENESYDIENGQLRTKPKNGFTYGTDYWPLVRLGDYNEEKWMWADCSTRVHIEDEINQEKFVGRVNLPWANSPEYWPQNLTKEQMPPFKDSYINEGDLQDPNFSTYIWQTYLNAGHILIRRNFLEGNYLVQSEIFLNQVQPRYEQWYDFNKDGLCELFFAPFWLDGKNVAQMPPKESVCAPSLFLVAHTWGPLEWGGTQSVPISSYQANKTFIVIVKGIDIAGQGTITSRVYLPSNETNSLSISPPMSKNGLVALYGSGNLPDMDNVRIIPNSGYYISTLFYPNETDGFEYGAFTGTVTNLDGATYPGIINVNLITSNPNAIQYRADFATHINDTNFTNTVTLEDVTIKYLPRTKILYWQEVAD